MRHPLSLVLTANLCAALATPGFAQEGSSGLPLPQAATPAEAAPPVAVAPDTALLLPLLEALAAPPSRRAGLLKPILASADPRAVAALRYAGLHDRNPAVGEAAIEALREVALPEAVSAVVDIAVGTEVGQPKPGALGALSRHAHPSGADAISDDKPDATKKLASAGPSLPNWLRWPFDAVTAVPCSDPTGKVDGVMLQAISVW